MKSGTTKLMLWIVLLLIFGCATSPLKTCQSGISIPCASTASGSPLSAGHSVVAGNDIEVTVLSKTVSSWDGDLLPHYPSSQPEITILRIRIQPGVSLPLHQHPVINAGVLIKGQLTVLTDDGKELNLHAGDGIVELVDKLHYGRNDGETPAEIIVFYAGSQDAPITVYQNK